MINYEDTCLARFIERPNRFIAKCELVTTKKIVTVHVKNTGRCKELLLPHVLVSLSYCPSPTRKTDYDLISVQKGTRWVNIDSQLPNELVAQGFSNKQLILPNLQGKLNKVIREKTFGHSRFDFYLETDKNEKVIVEVKGLTLEHQQVGSFPDAPSKRAQKHVTHLINLMDEGYLVYFLFVIQMEGVAKFTLASQIDPDFSKVVIEGIAKGLQVVGYDCFVTEKSIQLNKQVSFEPIMIEK